MIEDRYLRFYYENYFLNDKCNWGYLYAISCIANREKPEPEDIEEACETQQARKNCSLHGLRKHEIYSRKSKLRARRLASVIDQVR